MLLFKNQRKCFLGTLIQKIIKIINLRGDLANILAKKEALDLTGVPAATNHCSWAFSANACALVLIMKLLPPVCIVADDSVRALFTGQNAVVHTPRSRTVRSQSNDTFA